MSLTQQFHLLKRICHSVDACCDCSSPPVHAPATASALRHALRYVTESLLDQRLKGRIFSFEALHLLLDASMGAQLLILRCCNASQGFAEASTAHIFINLAPILYSRIAAAAEMLHVAVPTFDPNVPLSDLAAQLTAIQATASVGSSADASSSHLDRSQVLADLLVRLHKEPRGPIVPGELLNLSMVSVSWTHLHFSDYVSSILLTTAQSYLTNVSDSQLDWRTDWSRHRWSRRALQRVLVLDWRAARCPQGSHVR
jgi:hypothetical protein